MKKVIVLCSALVFGLCSESSAWEVDFTEIDQGLETFTPKLSLVAVRERVAKLKSVSGDTGIVQREFRRLYNDWLSNNTKWTGQGRNSTIDNIQGYCSSNPEILTEFEKVLKGIEEKINAATGETAEIEGESTKEQQEQAIDFTDAIKENPKIQRNALETAVNAMETSLYDDLPTIDINYTSFGLESLAKLWGQDDIGVDVDEDFIVSLRRAWSMQALDMSEDAIDERVGTGDEGRTYKKVDPNIFSNSDIATFLLDHFERTDTGSNKKIPGSNPEKNTVWNLSSEGHPKIEELLKYGRDDIQLTDEGVSKEIRDSLMRIFDVKYEGGGDDDDDVNDAKYKKLTNLGIEKNGKEFKIFKNMKFHLNLVARLLQEIGKEKDKISEDVDEYKVDGIVFHAFRQYMTQAFREAISLIKASEEI